MRDLDIRLELFKNFLAVFESDHTSKVVPELGLCQGDARIDIAVINGALHGYEIKSERDTLVRLPNQINVYNRIFDYINIVTNESHLNKVERMVPKFWGIMFVKQMGSEFKIEVKRRPGRNEQVDSQYLVQLLWKNEALQVLKEEGLEKGMKSKKRTEIWQKIAVSLPLEKVTNYVREHLKKREKWRLAD